MLGRVSGIWPRRYSAYSTTGTAPAAAPLDQMFRPLDLTVSFVRAIVALSSVHPLGQVINRNGGRQGEVCGRR